MMQGVSTAISPSYMAKICGVVEIIQSGTVRDNSEKHFPTLLQTKNATLAQLRADGQSPVQMCVADDPFRR